MIRSVLSCRYKTVEYLLKGFFVIAVLYFSFFTHEILAEASTARQIKTIEYSFGNTLTATTSSTTILYATDSGVGSGMGWSTSTPTLASQGINYQIHGSNIRIVDAWVEFRAVTSKAGSFATNIGSVADSKWHYVGVSYISGGALRVYFDGSLVTSSTSPTFTMSSQNLRIGRSVDTYWETYKGSIDDIRIYNRILSSQEVKALYKLGAQ